MEVKTSWGLQKCWVEKLGNHNALHYPSEHRSDGYWSEIREETDNWLIETTDLLAIVRSFWNGMVPLLVGVIGQSFRLWFDRDLGHGT